MRNYLPFLITILLFTTSSPIAFAQQRQAVTIKVSNTKKEAIGFASITVTNRLHPEQVEKKVADSTGIAVFQLSKNNQYTINITAVDYTPFEKSVAITGAQSGFQFILEPAGKTIEGVVVTSRKPLMRQEEDKTIVDPENLAASSTSGYEVIEKTPGLFVDQDGNIYINSLTPATVYINGREMKMSAADVATMLKSLPPNSIAKIEILKTPSAKYDASGSGGIVNLVLKKGVRIGMTGSVNAGWQQGTYANEFVGFNLNSNNGKRSSYLNLNFSNRNSYERIKTDREFAPDSLLSQNAFTKYPATVYFAGFGLSYALTKKWELSYDGRASLNDFNNKTENPGYIQKISTGYHISDNLNNVGNDGSSFLINNSVSANYKIDSAGSTWSTDIAHTYAKNKANQVFNTVFFTPVYGQVGGDGASDNDRHFLTAQTDLKWKLKKQYTLETGIKTSLLGFKSVTDYYETTGGVRVKDPRRTNTFDYNENINSIYVQGSKSISDIVIKAGLRAENTNMKGHQSIPDDTTFTIHRTDLFPYIYLSKHVMKIAGFDLRAYIVYRRTIIRPVYEQLNPFPRVVDQYLSETGNPSLRPQFNQNYEANISVDEMPILAVGVNDTRDIFTSVIYQSDTASQSQAYRTYDNLGKNREWYIRGLGAIPPGGKYFLVIGGQYNHNYYRGFYEETPLSFKKGTWTFFMYQTLKLGKLSLVTLNGFVRFKGQQQFYELTSFGALNASINRQFFKQKLTITASISDIFATNKNNFTIRQGSVAASGFRQNDTRRFGLNLRYNFGTRKKEETNMFNVEQPAN